MLQCILIELMWVGCSHHLLLNVGWPPYQRNRTRSPGRAPAHQSEAACGDDLTSLAIYYIYILHQPDFAFLSLFICDAGLGGGCFKVCQVADHRGADPTRGHGGAHAHQPHRHALPGAAHGDDTFPNSVTSTFCSCPILRLKAVICDAGLGWWMLQSLSSRRSPGS